MRLVLAALVLSVGFVFPAPGFAITQTFSAGLVDDFELPEDPTSPSPALVDYLTNDLGFSLIQFDPEVKNNFVAHTFDIPALPGPITEGNLVFRGRSCPIGCAVNDRIILGFTLPESPTIVAYDVMLADLAGFDWNNSVEALFDIELTSEVVSGMNEFGFLDVLVFDDTAVDFYELTINFVPEPSTAALLAVGVIGLSGFGFRRGRGRA